jgi:hypothetical protein
MNITHEMIRLTAYALWELRGRPSGCPEEDWYEAEALLRGGEVGPGASASAGDGPRWPSGQTRYGLRTHQAS